MKTTRLALIFGMILAAGSLLYAEDDYDGPGGQRYEGDQPEAEDGGDRERPRPRYRDRERDRDGEGDRQRPRREGRRDGEGGKNRPGGKLQGMIEKNLPGAKEEMERHRKAMKAIMDEMKEYGKTVREKAKTAENEEAKKAVVEEAKTKLKDFAAKMVDERINHAQKMLDLRKANRDKAVEQTTEMLKKIVGKRGHGPRDGKGPRGEGIKGNRENRKGGDGERREEMRKKWRERREERRPPRRDEEGDDDRPAPPPADDDGEVFDIE